MSEWSDQQIARLRELWDGPDSTAAIGGKMGMSKNAVVGKAKRLNLPARPSPIIRDGRPVKPKSAPRVHGATLTLPPSIIAAQAAEKAAERALVAKLSEIVAAATEPEPEAPRVEFKPLAPRQCCWPLWDGKPTHRYCEAVARPGRAYCSAHHEIAYTKPQREGGDMAPWVRRDQGLQVVA
jgi:GcrA cell cycle regulator